MKQEIYLNHQRFERECDIFVQKFSLCRKIVSLKLYYSLFLPSDVKVILSLFNRLQKVARMTDAVFNDDVLEEANIDTADELNQFWKAVNKNLEIMAALIEYHNKTTDYSFNELISIRNDLTLFTFKQCDVSQYAENTMGECVVTKVENIATGRCYINDFRK